MSDYGMSDDGDDGIANDDDVPNEFEDNGDDDEPVGTSSSSRGSSSCIDAESNKDCTDEDDDESTAAVDEEPTEVRRILAPKPRAVYTGDVLLPLERAALEGREANRIDAGGDLVHSGTRGCTVALDLARMFIADEPSKRPPYAIIRELPDGSIHRVLLRHLRIARPVCDALPSP